MSNDMQCRCPDPNHHKGLMTMVPKTETQYVFDPSTKFNPDANRNPMNDPDIHLKTVKSAALEAIQTLVDDVDKSVRLTINDVYVVWFSYTLQNFKALVSTNSFDGVYIEVTYDVTHNRLYVDTYGKISNVRIDNANKYAR